MQCTGIKKHVGGIRVLDAEDKDNTGFVNFINNRRRCLGSNAL
jgi:hypothetical protein